MDQSETKYYVRQASRDYSEFNPSVRTGTTYFLFKLTDEGAKQLGAIDAKMSRIETQFKSFFLKLSRTNGNELKILGITSPETLMKYVTQAIYAQGDSPEKKILMTMFEKSLKVSPGTLGRMREDHETLNSSRFDVALKNRVPGVYTIPTNQKDPKFHFGAVVRQSELLAVIPQAKNILIKEPEKNVPIPRI